MIPKELDLNLLLILEAVISTRSTTIAAANLGMRQPAVSRSIARLREIVGYDLIMRNGHGVEPTTRAIELIERVRPALKALETALGERQPFDPAVSSQSFIVHIAAGLEATFLSGLAVKLAQAPNLKVSVCYGHARALQSELRYGTSSVALDYESVSDDAYLSELLFESKLMVISRRDHPALRDGLSAETYKAIGHVILNWSPGSGSNPLEPFLNAQGIVRQSPLVVPSISSVGLVCEKTNLLGTVSGRSAQVLSRRYDVDVHPMPIEVPPIRIYMAWHSSYDEDAGHRWLRQCMKGALAETEPGR